jgi:aminotransferase in exopolysaccharide biosynthesis
MGSQEWRYIKECLDSNWVSSAGKYVELFERNIAEYTGAKHAVACVNGTSALQVSLGLAGVRPGDEVIVPTLTFIAPVNSVSYNGAIPVFMDCDNYYNLNTEKTIDFIKNETKLTQLSAGSLSKSSHDSPVSINIKTGKRIAALIPAHIWGNAAWLEDLIPLCKERNISVVEDASESLGTVYSSGIFSDRHTGTIGKLGCLSFNGNKIITTGGGGMILTDDESLADKARYLTTQAKDDSVRYVHDEIGYNFRLTNIQAALGVAQLEQLVVFLECKQEITRQYRAAMEEIDGLTLASVPHYADNNHWMNLLQIDSNIYGMDREELMLLMEHNGIQTRPVWALNHRQRPYKDYQSYKIEKAEKLVKDSLCLPSSTSLSESAIQKVVDILNG